MRAMITEKGEVVSERVVGAEKEVKLTSKSTNVENGTKLLCSFSKVLELLGFKP